MYNKETAKRVTEAGRKTLSEIMIYLDENFTVGTEGQLIPRNPGPDVVIIDHISKLK